MGKFTKKIIYNEKFYISQYICHENAPSLLFVHGGPGLNCGALEYLIENDNFFENLDSNIVFYDQRACGRSVGFFDKTDKVSHVDNVTDLSEIYTHLSGRKDINLKGIIGHSYGAKLLFDFYQHSGLSIPGIFVSTADSILTPRMNNLASDLRYLKKVEPEKYKDIISKMDKMDVTNIWNLTAELSPIFNDNQERHLLYWANIELFEKIKEIQKKINLPVNQRVFMSVRKDLYLDSEKFSVNPDALNSPHLWINGFHDSIMGEPVAGLSSPESITLFPKSAHHPHIEENNRFCRTVNAFVKKL